MNALKLWFQNLVLRRLIATATQVIMSFSASHAFGQAGTLSDLHWVSPMLGIDLILKLTVDPVAFEAGLFLAAMTALEWLRHHLAQKYPDQHWL